MIYCLSRQTGNNFFRERGLVTKNTNKWFAKMRNNGSVLILASLTVFILSILGLGLLTTAYGMRLRAIGQKNAMAAKLAAEAGYEAAILWMNQQPDVISAMKGGTRGRSPNGTARITKSSPPGRTRDGSYVYTISFDRFLGNQPVYEIISKGHCYSLSRTVRSLVVQKVSGWDMALCRIPDGILSATQAFFSGQDIVNMPIHINSRGSPGDEAADIFISRRYKPQFPQRVSMGESRYKWFGTNKDKYSTLMKFFQGGIYFDQPRSRITNPRNAGTNQSAQLKVTRFKNSTSGTFRFAPAVSPAVSSALANTHPTWDSAPAVQLEFYETTNGVGMVRATDNCTVCLAPSAGNDYMLDAVGTNRYMLYPIYGYHYADTSKDSLQVNNFTVPSTYVSQEMITPKGRVASTNAGGQIYVDGNVIIGGAVGTDSNGNMVMAGTPFPSRLNGQITIVATGNIWIVSPIVYAGPQDVGYQSGFLTKQVPSANNQNVLGLFSQFGVVKVIDPQLSSNVPISIDDPRTPAAYPDTGGSTWTYQPVAFQKQMPSRVWNRQLLDPSQPTAVSMVVQASITSCGGGWGVENIGARIPGTEILIVAGSITDSVQGGVDGLKKCYYFDQRLSTGILPGDMWLQSKYISTPGGWNDS